jgi:hypothetical protein
VVPVSVQEVVDDAVWFITSAGAPGCAAAAEARSAERIRAGGAHRKLSKLVGAPGSRLGDHTHVVDARSWRARHGCADLHGRGPR